MNRPERSSPVRIVVWGAVFAGANVAASWAEYRPWGIPNFSVATALVAFIGAIACLIWALILFGNRRRLDMGGALIAAGFMAGSVYLTAGPMGAMALRSVTSRGDVIVGAVRRFEADHAAPPRSLDELVPAYLTELPPGTAYGSWDYSLSSDKAWYLAMSLGAWEVLGYRSDQEYEPGIRRVGAWEQRH